MLGGIGRLLPLSFSGGLSPTDQLRICFGNRSLPLLFENADPTFQFAASFAMPVGPYP